ncbi:MAG: hypothetical protein K6C69_04455 [Lachnospiraceae bacterium]|nr:hypothetical protein [Lachnospiraceae bacterium]
MLKEEISSESNTQVLQGEKPKKKHRVRRYKKPASDAAKKDENSSKEEATKIIKQEKSKNAQARKQEKASQPNKGKKPKKAKDTKQVAKKDLEHMASAEDIAREISMQKERKRPERPEKLKSLDEYFALNPQSEKEEQKVSPKNETKAKNAETKKVEAKKPEEAKKAEAKKSGKKPPKMVEVKKPVQAPKTMEVKNPKKKSEKPKKVQETQKDQKTQNHKKKYSFYYASSSKILHDQSCKLINDIPESRLHGSDEYIESMKQCPVCAYQAYLRVGAKDYQNLSEYLKFFQEIGLSPELAHHMYIEKRMKTEFDTQAMELVVRDREDTWKILKVGNSGKVRLMHNNYRVDEKKHRVFIKGYHVQSEFTSMCRPEDCISTIENYSFNIHRFDASMAKIKAREEEGLAQEERSAGTEEKKDGFFKKLTDLFRREDCTKDSQGMEGKDGDFRKDVFFRDLHVDLTDFTSVKDGYPKTGTICLYLWRDVDGNYRLQTGVYEGRGNFVVQYGDRKIFDRVKIVAWKKLNDIVVIGKENYL